MMGERINRPRYFNFSEKNDPPPRRYAGREANRADQRGLTVNFCGTESP